MKNQIELEKPHLYYSFWIKTSHKVELRIKDLKARLDIEMHKPYLESFLHATPDWYKENIKKYEALQKYCIFRRFQAYKKLNNYYETIEALPKD